jgi:hypothetical protein
VDEIFSKRPYLVVRMPSARKFAGKKRNRNERQRSCNLLMRNLLTTFARNRNYEMRRKILCVDCKLFQQLAGKFFSIAGLQKLVGARILSLCTLPCTALAKFFHRNRLSFFRVARNCAARITRDARLITAILLLSFAVQLRLNFSHPKSI